MGVTTAAVRPSDSSWSTPVNDLVWKCHKGPQRELMFGELGKVREIGWGGAKGGGKSEVVGPKCIQHINEYPQHARVLILREDFPQLSDLMERMAPQCRAAGGVYNKQEKVWRFPEGATIRFGYFQGGKSPHWGKEFTFIVIDEVTRCIATEAEYLKLMLSLRNGHGIAGQILTLTNPGGQGHNWWKSRFLNVPAKTVQKDAKGLARVFIPARLSDNPTLDNDSEEGQIYRAVLESLGDAERQAFLDGDWDAFEGTVFKLQPGIHTWTWVQFRERTGHDEIPKEWTRIRVMDWGFAKPFAIYWLAVGFDGRAFCYREWYGVAKDGRGGFVPNKGISMEPKLVAAKVATIEKTAAEKNVTGFADPACWAKGQGDHGGGPSVIEAFASEGVYWSKAKNDRISGKMALHERLRYDGTKPDEWPGLVFITEECPHAIRTIPAVTYDEHIPEDVDTEGEDHAYDTIRYFCMSRPWAPKKIDRRDGWRDRTVATAADWMTS